MSPKENVTLVKKNSKVLRMAFPNSLRVNNNISQSSHKIAVLTWSLIGVPR
jgi:hypothetical protein